MLEEVRELSAAVSQVHELLLQIVDAISQDPQLAGPTANGAGSDGRSQRGGFLATKDLNKLWKRLRTKKHWVVRARINSAMVHTSVEEL